MKIKKIVFLLGAGNYWFKISVVVSEKKNHWNLTNSFIFELSFAISSYNINKNLVKEFIFRITQSKTEIGNNQKIQTEFKSHTFKKFQNNFS